MANLKEEYRGIEINFDTQKEEWYIIQNKKRQSNASLKLIKSYIDRQNKKAFERIPVYVHKRGDYSWRNAEGYEKAWITSIGLDGTIFIVREGRKSADQDRTCYARTDANAKIIANIEKLTKAFDEAKEAKEAAERSLKSIDTYALANKYLGKN